MKYNIEGGDIDFFEELKKDTEKINVSHCYITDEPLVEHFITLNCNHTFNYLPFFYTTYNQKYKANFKTSQIKCTYCRKKQSNYILPYIPELINVKILGINSTDPNSNILCSTVGSVSEIVKCNYEETCFNLGSMKFCSKLICSFHYNSHKQKILYEEKLAIEAAKIAKAQALEQKKQNLIIKKQAIEDKKKASLLKKKEMEQKKIEKALLLKQKKEESIAKKEAAIQLKLIKKQEKENKKLL